MLLRFRRDGVRGSKAPGKVNTRCSNTTPGSRYVSRNVCLPPASGPSGMVARAELRNNVFGPSGVAGTVACIGGLCGRRTEIELHGWAIVERNRKPQVVVGVERKRGQQVQCQSGWCVGRRGDEVVFEGRDGFVDLSLPPG